MTQDKFICFSLWGDSKFYNYGIVENVLLAKNIYPDYKCLVYIGRDVLPCVISFLKQQDNTIIIDYTHNFNNMKNMLWRYDKLFNDNSNSIFLVRDCDSRLNMREKKAVEEWLDSDYDFHIMRDHNSGHFGKILGGMMGCRNNILNKFKNLFDDFNNCDGLYWCDMNLLEIIYPKIVNNSMIHASSFQYEKHSKNFPDSEYPGFVGEPIYRSPLADNIFNDNNNFLIRNHSSQSNAKEEFIFSKKLNLDKNIYGLSIEISSDTNDYYIVTIKGDKAKFNYITRIPIKSIKTEGQQIIDYDISLSLDSDIYTILVSSSSNNLKIHNVFLKRTNNEEVDYEEFGSDSDSDINTDKKYRKRCRKKKKKKKNF